MDTNVLCNELQSIIQDTIDKRSLLGRTTKKAGLVSESTKLPDTATFLISQNFTMDYLMKVTALNACSNPYFLNNDLEKMLGWVDQNFVSWMKKNALKKELSISKDQKTISAKKEYILSNVQTQIANDFKGFMMYLRETIFSSDLAIRICKSDLFRITNSGSFTQNTKRICSNQTFVSVSDNLEPCEILSFIYDFTYFPRPQVEVKEIQENMYSVRIFFISPNPEYISVKPILYQYE